VSLHSLLGLAVRARQAFVLAEMLRPGGNDERFDVPIFILHVAEDAPRARAVGASALSIFTNRFEEFRRLF